MNRKLFITSASLAAIALPVTYYFKSNKWDDYPPTALPEFLISFCTIKDVIDIGVAYIKMTPAENTNLILTNLIVVGKETRKKSAATVEIIESKIKDDFTNKDTLIINGWVISRTEARQCALFSLIH
jgi:hypothetical protein